MGVGMASAYLGIDIGTSNIKAHAFDAGGYELRSESRECAVSYPSEGRCVASAKAIFDSFLAVTSSVVRALGDDGHKVRAMGFSAHMHSLLCVDRDGEAISDVMLWADTRARSQAEGISRSVDVAAWRDATGCRVQHPMYPLSKLLWIKENDGDLFKGAHKFVTLKEYMLHRLFGEYYCDYTTASSQGYYNIRSQSWDAEALGYMGVAESRLGTVVECCQALGRIKGEYERILGLDGETVVVAGSGDGIMANLGCGVTDNSKVSSSIGTSGAVRTTVREPVGGEAEGTWCYSFTKDSWVVGGAIHNGGLALKWIKREFGPSIEGYLAESGQRRGMGLSKAIDLIAGGVPPGSEGLTVLPHFTGERSPDWNADAKGMMAGLTMGHTFRHIIRATMEGVMYRLRSVFLAMGGCLSGDAEVIANGGYAYSPVWLQMQADIFGRAITVNGVEQASALGAAYLAMHACGDAPGL
ncbi:MAG: gluconokinase, partial [Oscillospiraceae bacterium]|nr:gluconokinase [Oscillospiraceae bacterium]